MSSICAFQSVYLPLSIKDACPLGLVLDLFFGRALFPTLKTRFRKRDVFPLPLLKQSMLRLVA
jgi:hypothetical protein